MPQQDATPNLDLLRALADVAKADQPQEAAADRPLPVARQRGSSHLRADIESGEFFVIADHQPPRTIYLAVEDVNTCDPDCYWDVNADGCLSTTDPDTRCIIRSHFYDTDD